ncbi:antiterminator Q family protein [Pantoea cypripedii]|nr:antiterminator Q family protein [Pantoea cypripedii]MBP2199345.1 hypothetical protein [Pantoea cypripedii]
MNCKFRCLGDGPYAIENEIGHSRIAAGFKGLLPEEASVISCSENDALIIDVCVGRLKKKREDEYPLIFNHYVKDISKSSPGRKLRGAEGMIRIKLMMAEGFVEGCLSMLDIRLEMDNQL